MRKKNIHTMGKMKRLKHSNRFDQFYETLCIQKSVSPLATIQANLADNRLKFCCDRVNYEDWSPILNSLASKNNSLVEIHIYSRYRPKKVHETIDTQEKLEKYRRFRATNSRAPIIYTNFLLRCFVDAVAVCARDSTSLTSLSLDGIPLADDKYLDILCAGLMANRNLQNLSLARCRIGDQGCGILFGAILEDSWLQVIDLTACSLTSKSAGFLTIFLKKKRVKLLECMWNQTGIPNGGGTETKHGLQKLVLDQNQKFGDDGFLPLAKILKDDFWLKTLSIRRCGLTKASGDAIIDLLETNSIIETMNFKKNKIPVEMLRTVRRLLKRRQEKGERIPLKSRLFDRKKDLKWRTASRKKRTKNRRRLPRGTSKKNKLKSKRSEFSVGNRWNLMQLNDRLSKIIDCNRNLTRILGNSRQLLVNEKLSRLNAERSYQMLRPAFNKLLQGVQKQDGIRSKIQTKSKLCAKLRKIFQRLEWISAKNGNTLGEVSDKNYENEDKAMIDHLSTRRIIRSAQKRPHCPPRQKV